MITIRALSLTGVALALGGCGLGSTTPPPAVVATPAVVVPASAVPTVEIASTPKAVRSILIQRARARGSSPTETDSAVVIQRELPSTNAKLAEACGPQVPGRQVRVVLGTEATDVGTRVTEQRYIIDADKVCQVPLSEADVKQSEASLNEVKTQAERRATARR